MSIATIETRLANVRTAIDTIVSGGVAEFEHEGGDRAKMLDLAQLRQLEDQLMRQLASARRASRGRFQPIRPITIT